MSILKRKRAAFSLIELSVVIFIMSILVAGSLSILGASNKISKKKLTQERIQIIYNAIGNYLAKNYHLPCPAPLTNTRSDANYGVEGGTVAEINTSRECIGTGIYSSNNVTSITYGMVPVNTLGLADEIAEDGYGNRFIYVVTDKLTSPNYNDVTGGIDGFSYYTEIDTDLVQIYSAKSSSIIKQNVAFAIISHGDNKYGGYGPNSTTQNSSGGTIDEKLNLLSNISANTADFGDNTSYSGYVTLTSDDNDGFDDIIFYKTRDEIIGDFKLNFLYFCDNNDANYDDANYTPDFNYGYNGQVVYGDGVSTCDFDGAVVPAKKCGLNGTAWTDITACPALEMPEA